MRLTDIVKISQRNLLRSKLRTFLTIAAVFIGALTLSLTNGVGNGIKSYVNTQLGNLGVKNTLIMEAKQTQGNPLSNDVRKYEPEKKTGLFNTVLLDKDDLTKIQETEGVIKVIPLYNFRIEYVYAGGEKLEASAEQYLEGLNLEMIAGRTIHPGAADEVSIPSRYIKPGTENNVIGKYIAIGYKDSSGKVIEKPVKVVGVQQQSLLGNSGINISSVLAEEIYLRQTQGISSLSNGYTNAVALFEPNYSDSQITELKKRLNNAGYNGTTLEDQIGTISQVINGILMVLNVFGVITLLAAAFGIINTLLMSVNERTSEIGLMKALGANRKTIFSIFAIEAASIGFWGALLGVLVSIVLGAIASNIATNSFLKDFVGFKLLAFPLLPSLGVLFGIMLLSFIAGALPSLKASKLDPIKALRYE